MAIYSGFSHRKWWFSTAMLNYQRVSILGGFHGIIFRRSNSITWNFYPCLIARGGILPHSEGMDIKLHVLFFWGGLVNYNVPRFWVRNLILHLFQILPAEEFFSDLAWSSHVFRNRFWEDSRNVRWLRSGKKLWIKSRVFSGFLLGFLHLRWGDLDGIQRWRMMALSQEDSLHCLVLVDEQAGHLFVSPKGEEGWKNFLNG